MSGFDSVFNRDDIQLEPEDFKGWTALPTLSHEDAHAGTAGQQVADLNWADLTLAVHTTIGAPWQPVLVTMSEEGEQSTYVLPMKFDTKRECQEFIADHILGSSWYPTEDFD